MKLESVIKPRNGTSRTVTVHGTRYDFVREERKGDPSPHYVATLSPAHADVLLASGWFFEAGKPATLRRAPQGPVAPEPVEEAIDETTTPGWPDEITTEATQLIAGSASSIGTDVGKVSSLDVVRCALELEAAADKPRSTVQALLQSTLDGAVAAGVAG